MSYTLRQQRCLEAMGVVPWVLKPDAPAAPGCMPSEPLEAEPPTVIEAPLAGLSTAPEQEQGMPPITTDSAAAPTAAPTAEPVSAEPVELAEWVQWLPAQPVSPFQLQHQWLSAHGANTAPVLVVVDIGADAGSGYPLSGDALKLFDLMLRAIQLTRRDVRICAISTSTADKAASASTVAPMQSPTVAELVTPHTRAVLCLQQFWPVTLRPSEVADDHGCRGSVIAQSIWRIPHPEVLLQQNLLKRQAWHVLQAIRALLQPV